MTKQKVARLTTGLAAFLATCVVHADKSTIAVFDFDIGNSTTTEVRASDASGSSKNLSIEKSRRTNLLTNKIVAELASSGEVAVVERERLNQLMKEVQLTEADLTDPKSAIQIGQLLGADHMIFGSITLVEPSVSITKLPYGTGQQKVTAMTVAGTVRIVETETGHIKAAKEIRGHKSVKHTNPESMHRTVPDSFKQNAYSLLAQKMAHRIIDTLSPIQVAKQTSDIVYLTRAGMEVGEQYQVVRLGEEIHDPDNPEKVLGRTETKVADIRVIDGLNSMSKAKVIEWHVTNKDIPPGSVARLLQ